jgi:integrase/recombinase XerD
MTAPEEAIRAFLDHLIVERAVSKHTASAYRRDLARYASYLREHGVTDLDQVTPVRIADYAARLREGVRARGGDWQEPPLADASVARAVVAVRSLHRFAHAEGMTADDPARTVSPPKPPGRLPKALSIAQVEALLAAPGEETALALRDTALLELLYSTGIRISEAVQLDVDDIWHALRAVDGQTPTLRVLGKGSKERVVPLGSYARSAIDRYLVRARPGLAAQGPGTPALLLNARGGRLSRQSAWTVVQANAGKAGIKADISPHTLRHSFATHLLDGGADVRVVQELLGHASVTTTQIYTLITVDHLRQVYLTSHPRAY